MNIVARHPYVSMLAVFAIAVGVATIDYNVLKHESHQEVVYQRPATESTCRDPKVGEELRVWIDKRTSEKEGVRTCRVIPIAGDDSPRKAWKKAMKL